MVVQSEKGDQLIDDEEREMTSGSSSTYGLKQKDDGNDGNVSDDDICTEDPIGRKATDMQGGLPPGITFPSNITKQETEHHEVTHIPYRAWCPHCVRGQASNNPRRKRAEEVVGHEAETVPQISLDCKYLEETDEQG